MSALVKEPNSYVDEQATTFKLREESTDIREMETQSNSILPSIHTNNFTRKKTLDGFKEIIESDKDE